MTKPKVNQIIKSRKNKHHIIGVKYLLHNYISKFLFFIIIVHWNEVLDTDYSVQWLMLFVILILFKIFLHTLFTGEKISPKCVKYLFHL